MHKNVAACNERPRLTSKDSSKLLSAHAILTSERGHRAEVQYEPIKGLIVFVRKLLDELYKALLLVFASCEYLSQKINKMVKM